jgi:hypothetical protein
MPVIADLKAVPADTVGGFTQKLLTAAAPAPIDVPEQLVAVQPAASQVFVVKLQTLPVKLPSFRTTCAAPDEREQS